MLEVVQEKTAALEQRERLSRSVIWRLQRSYFNRYGIEAWSTGTVPHHITSSPFIADAYARMVLSYLRDCAFSEQRGESSTIAALDRSEPVYIVELGSGSGRFSYLFLSRILDRYRSSVLKNIPINYVMTDFAEQNLEYCRRHPWFQSFIKDGLLDFARFDVESDQNLKLIHSGETISANDLKKPLVVIANYVFDSIPQDAFFVSDGQLYESLVTLTTTEQEQELQKQALPSRLELSYEGNPVDGNYYQNASWNRILLDYKRRLSETHFLFPTAALQCIRRLYHLSSGRMLLLSGDRGYSSDEALLEGKGVPTMALHGSFSMMVDYQIIGEYCRHLGGQVLHPGRNAESLNISAFMFGDPPGGFVETQQAYAEAIEKFGPDDFFTLKEGIAQIYDALTLDQLLAFLRLSCWDYKRFWECLPILKKQLPDISNSQKQQLHDVIMKVWDSYLPIGEESDFAFELGTLLLEIGFQADALEFLQCSVDLNGTAPGTAYNIAVCHYSLGEMDQARDYLNQVLDLDPEFVEAQTLLRELESMSAGAIRKQRRKKRA